jgi:hypothetical protein
MSNERFREKTIDFKIVQKKKSTSLNESAQIGDKVTYDGKKGYVIGQSLNGDLLVQVQGSVDFAKPSKVKVMGMKAKAMELPIKFDEKTQKVLFEQFIRCGIYMGNTPVKTSNCFVKYSQWKDAKINENINVISDGEFNTLPKENVKIFDDPNDFANPQDYVPGVEIDPVTGDAISNVLMHALDFSQSMGAGDSTPVRIIRGPESDNPQMDTVSKGVLQWLPDDKY